MGGGILNTKNAFTLIELLAIIVILAIIAVITVPIILNIIENSRKGAATDSAYGYKDAVDKAYVTELSKPNQEGLKLNGTYEVQSDGTLIPATGSTFGIANYTLPVSLSGEKPSGGKLAYENNVLTEGCLAIGDYKITFESGSVDKTEKGDCSDYEFPLNLTMSEMCPGCKFIYSSSDNQIEIDNMPTEDEGLTDDYTTLIGTGGHPCFLGLIESTTTQGKIGRAFTCGVKAGIPFCLEGGIDESSLTEKTVYNSNVGILNTMFPSCNTSVTGSNTNCSDSGMNGAANYNGIVDVVVDGDGCIVYEDGSMVCHQNIYIP